jgi:hypothetical protein
VYNTYDAYHFTSDGWQPTTYETKIQQQVLYYFIRIVVTQSYIFNTIAYLMQYEGLPKDMNAVYFFLTLSDIKMTGFCSQFCACNWYFSFTSNPTDQYKYAFVGNPATQCSSNCTVYNKYNSKNSNPGADMVASIIAHELEETHTDPESSG